MPLFLICKSLTIIFLSQTVIILPLPIKILLLSIIIIPQRRKKRDLKKARSSRTFFTNFFISKNSYKQCRLDKPCSAERTRYALTPSLSFKARGVYRRRHRKNCADAQFKKKKKNLRIHLTKILAAGRRSESADHSRFPKYVGVARQESQITRLMHKYQRPLFVVQNEYVGLKKTIRFGVNGFKCGKMLLVVEPMINIEQCYSDSYQAAMIKR